MVREFKLPDVGEGVAEGELVSWLVAEGDEVTEDQPVAEVETDKALVEVPSPVDGTVRELRYEEGDVIPVGEVFVTFDVDGEATADVETDATPEQTDEAPEPATGSTDAEPAGDPGATGEDVDEVPTAGGRVFAPPSVRRFAREAGVDLSKVSGSGPGGRITEGDVRAAAGSDDESTVESGDDPADDGGAVAASTDVGTAVESAVTETATGTESEAESAVADTAAAGAIESADRDRTLAAPATRRIAKEEGVDIDAVPASEERDGEAFVTPEAVREYAEAQQRAQEADAQAVAAGESLATPPAEGERERREPLRGVRKRIAEAMAHSKYTAPHVTHHDEVDVTRLVEIREELKRRADDRGIRLTYMPFVTKAVIAALKEFPEMNAMIDDANEEIVYRNYYNIGIATATDVGLMVPVIEDADRKGLLQLASEMDELVRKARDRTIGPDELRGSTFTITNIGGIGGEYATPIINYPEAGILALGEIKRKPRVVVDEETGAESIEPRSVLTLSLSLDHRLIDGAVGARFTNAVMERLENPELLLLE